MFFFGQFLGFLGIYIQPKTRNTRIGSRRDERDTLDDGLAEDPAPPVDEEEGYDSSYGPLVSARVKIHLRTGVKPGAPPVRRSSTASELQQNPNFVEEEETVDPAINWMQVCRRVHPIEWTPSVHI